MTSTIIRPVIQPVRRKPLPPEPRYEYNPTLLSPEQSVDLFAQLKGLSGWKLEGGSCTLEPTHSTVQFGPRQAYLDCVPKIYRVQSSGEVPDFLAAYQVRLEEMYDCTFNSVQINWHYDQNAVVHAHMDSNPGHICMLSLGAERVFVLQYQRAGGYAKFFDQSLASGSLLTLFPKDQWRMFHSMPRSKTPCGSRFSIIFRYIPLIGTKHMLKDETNADKKRIRAERDAEYFAAQEAGRARRQTSE